MKNLKRQTKEKNYQLRERKISENTDDITQNFFQVGNFNNSPNNSIIKPYSYIDLKENSEEIYLSFVSYEAEIENTPDQENKNKIDNIWSLESEILQELNMNVQPLTKQSIEPGYGIEKNECCLNSKFRRCRFCLVIKVKLF